MTSAIIADVQTAQLPSGARLLIEAPGLGGDEPVAARIPALSDVLSTIREFTDQIGTTLMAGGAKKMTAEFGISLAVESGSFIAVIAKGTASVNLKISMTFES